ncbi:MAG: HEAT repeat domain-containing protein [Planctomycetota bacterium]|nr:HEAT repeat domain-containing protein [Planctomycetota bacterium]
MSKLAFILALYAAGIATWLWLDRGASPGVQGTPAAESAGHPEVRAVLGEVRTLWRAELKDTLRDVNWRFAEMDTLRKSMETGVQSMQKAAEDSSQANYGMLESIKEDVQRFGKATNNLEAVVSRLEALEARLKVLEERPAQVIREVVTERGPGPVAPKDDGPKRPSLPTEPERDPAEVAREIEEARAALGSEDVDKLFPAIERIREHRVLDAVPRLIEILANHKDEFGRTAAASALGDMRIADAVIPLAEALVDKSDLVANQAAKAIRQITDFDTELTLTAGIRGRRAARGRVKEWWRAHEAAVRATLEQPAKGP